MSPEEISKVFIFSSLNEEELTEIEKIIRIRIYNKGDTIFLLPLINSLSICLDFPSWQKETTRSIS